MSGKRRAVKTSECDSVAKIIKKRVDALSGNLSEKSKISITSRSKKTNAAALQRRLQKCNCLIFIKILFTFTTFIAEL